MINPHSTNIDSLVTVVMPTCNGEEFLRESVDSVLDQTYPHVELIVVDDGSTDGTSELLASYGDRITAISIANSGGPSCPRNTGIAKARGTYIAFCDGDDLMAPTAVADAMQIFHEFAEVSVTWADCQTISRTGEIEKKSVLLEYQDFRADLLSTFHPEISLIESSRMYSSLLRGLFLGISAVIVKKDVFDQVGSFDEALKNSDDREMWLRIARAGYGFAFRDKILFSYRQHSQSVSNRGHRRMPAVITNLTRQLEYLPEGDDRDFVLDKIMNCHLSQGWGLKSEKYYSEAEKSFWAALSRRVTVRGIRGVILSRLGLWRFPASSGNK